MSIDVNVLRKVRNNLPGHWYQGNYSDGHGNYCVLGHIAVALGEESGRYDDVGEYEYYELLNTIIVEQYPEFAESSESSEYAMPRWNDEKSRTEDEVIAILEKAIAKAEEQF
jgi:hypothetical protein